METVIEFRGVEEPDDTAVLQPGHGGRTKLDNAETNWDRLEQEDSQGLLLSLLNMKRD